MDWSLGGPDTLIQFRIGSKGDTSSGRQRPSLCQCASDHCQTTAAEPASQAAAAFAALAPSRLHNREAPHHRAEDRNQKTTSASKERSGPRLRQKIQEL